MIEIMDDGEGFSEDAVFDKNGQVQERVTNDGRKHIGINNIRWRLQQQCDGTMEINTSSSGTTVKITIPK